MKTLVAVLSICAALLLAPSLESAEVAQCVVHPTLGINIPSSHPGICLLDTGTTRGISQLTEDGLILLVPERRLSPVDPFQREGAMLLNSADARIIFCPGSADQVISGAAVTSCIDDSINFKAGPAAFAGRGQILVNAHLNKNGAAACPSSVHVRGMVSSPTGGNFDIQSSLVTFPGGMADGCETIERKVALSYSRPQDSTTFVTESDRRPAIDAKFEPRSTVVGTEAISPPSAPTDPSGNTGKGTQGIPEVLEQLASMRMTQLQMQALQIQTDRNTANRPFEVDASWCFEATPNLEIKGESVTRGTFQGFGKGGPDVYGFGFQGALHFGENKKFAREITGQMSFPKLVICVKGPVIKRLEGVVNTASNTAGDFSSTPGFSTADPLTDEQLALLAALAESQVRLKDRLTDVANNFNVSGQNIETVVDLAQNMSFDLSDPLASTQNIGELIKALPFNQEAREGFDPLTNLLDNVSLDTLKICERENPPAFLAEICNLTEGVDLRNSILTIKDVVDDIASAVSVDSCKTGCRQDRAACDADCNAGPLIGRRRCKNDCEDTKKMCIAACP